MENQRIPKKNQKIKETNPTTQKTLRAYLFLTQKKEILSLNHLPEGTGSLRILIRRIPQRNQRFLTLILILMIKLKIK